MFCLQCLVLVVWQNFQKKSHSICSLVRMRCWIVWSIIRLGSLKEPFWWYMEWIHVDTKIHAVFKSHDFYKVSIFEEGHDLVSTPVLSHAFRCKFISFRTFQHDSWNQIYTLLGIICLKTHMCPRDPLKHVCILFITFRNYGIVAPIPWGHQCANR